MQEKSENSKKIIDRLSQYIDNQGYNFNQIAKKIGVSNSYFNKMAKTRGSLGEDVINKILLYYDNINTEWFITGNGNMLKDVETRRINDSCASEPQAPYLHQSSSSSAAAIPLINIDALAGFGKGETKVLYERCDRYVIPAFKDAEFLIMVKGDSMVPTYYSGDMVACKKLALDDIFFQWNKIYVLDTCQGALVKRVKKGQDANHILCVSDNADYDPFELAIEQIYSIAIVVGSLRMD